MTPGKRNANRIEVTLSDERLRALDEARGNEARASFIKRAMDEAIAVPKRVPMERWPAVTPSARVVAGVPRPNVSAKPAVKPRPKQGKR